MSNVSIIDQAIAAIEKELAREIKSFPGLDPKAVRYLTTSLERLEKIRMMRLEKETA